MHTNGRHLVRFLIFEASLRSGSFNDRLATLATSVVEQHGGTVDRARMADFDCPIYDGDVEKDARIPNGAEHLRRRLVEVDAFIIASPEYNASTRRALRCADRSSAGACVVTAPTSPTSVIPWIRS
jgi:chromate reductase, NAD(P)H dehydrogenase (quinone)